MTRWGTLWGHDVYEGHRPPFKKRMRAWGVSWRRWGLFWLMLEDK